MKTHHCGELRKEDIGTHISLSGWVHRRRDHGGLIFIDLRDHGGLTQLVFDPNIESSSHKEAHQLRSEWVITIEGTVISRTEGMANPNMETGEIEIKVSSLKILSKAETPPFSICDEDDTKEELRLKYRYLDLRKGPLLENLKFRHKVTTCIRHFLDREGFFEVATPILSKSTPEGARDYLVPSRVHPYHFYALPQSPQVFKQLLMIGGLNRYFQICSCFRDEDLRADRQPEFTQVDIEMNFETPEFLFKKIESLFVELLKLTDHPPLDTPFLKMSYQDCMELYGTDKPDLRIPMQLKRIDDLAALSDFSVFKQKLEEKGTIKGLALPGGAHLSRRQIDEYTSWISQFGIKGLAWMKYQNNQLSSSIVKFFNENLQEKIVERFDLKDNDLVFFVADQEAQVNQGLDHLRRKLAKDQGLIENKDSAFLWVVDFPLFMRSDEGGLESSHHPFTAPHPDDGDLLDVDPLKVRSMSYDLVWNGYEIASGSQRIHCSETQEKIFKLLKLTATDIQEKFGSFVQALKYGTPPHLGIALGLDRMLMILLRTDNIKDVIAFPKTQKATDLMLNSPSQVEDQQLMDLQIDLKN